MTPKRVSMAVSTCLKVTSFGAWNRLLPILAPFVRQGCEGISRVPAAVLDKAWWTWMTPSAWGQALSGGWQAVVGRGVGRAPLELSLNGQGRAEGELLPRPGSSCPAHQVHMPCLRPHTKGGSVSWGWRASFRYDISTTVYSLIMRSMVASEREHVAGTFTPSRQTCIEKSLMSFDQNREG